MTLTPCKNLAFIDSRMNNIFKEFTFDDSPSENIQKKKSCLMIFLFLLIKSPLNKIKKKNSMIVLQIIFIINRLSLIAL